MIKLTKYLYFRIISAIKLLGVKQIGSYLKIDERKSP